MTHCNVTFTSDVIKDINQNTELLNEIRKELHLHNLIRLYESGILPPKQTMLIQEKVQRQIKEL